jgi:hypothetical protein
MILYNASDADNLFTDNHWVPTVHVDFTPGLAIKAYIASTASPTAQIQGNMLSTWPTAPSMTIFSSRGPNVAAMDIIKPDVTAPGLQILAGNSPLPADPASVPGELFQAIAGTSMSSPHVAGVFALIKQAHPDWSAAGAKSALMTTAYQAVKDNDRVNPADPFDMGAGHIDPGDKFHKGSLIDPGLVYEAGFLEYLGFLCDAGPEAFADPDATCATLESLGIPTEAHNLNYPSIGVAEVTGTEVVMRTVTSVATDAALRQYRVSVNAPPGFTAVVSPTTLVLGPGDTATYSVTFTNVSAPIGEWQFGSLTWKERSGKADVYSPIAVRGTLLDAPAEVSGTGTDGSLSFDVKFGYTGNYEANAHGLVPSTTTSDNVLQDPDQSFSPGDVAAGGANVHSFSLSDAAVFRIAMPPEATEPGADLDIYVFDPNGNLAATSTLSGTDELITIQEPMDGTWDVYVHGWLTPGGDSDYDLFSWIVSATPGGSLMIDSAPGSATSGATGTVQVSWSGLAAGDHYLGAVSHNKDGGVIGWTLVSVDTN